VEASGGESFVPDAEHDIRLDQSDLIAEESRALIDRPLAGFPR